MLAATDKLPRATIIWAGRNNATDPATVESDIADMVAALGHQRYLVLSLLNGSDDPAGDPIYEDIAEINAALATTYGAHFVDVRSYLVSLYDPNIPQDVTDHENDVPPSSLRTDSLHLNSAGYAAVAGKIFGSIGILEAGL